MDGFSGILDIGSVEGQKMVKDKFIDGKKIASRFKGKLVRMIRDTGGKFDYYSISPKIRQILLHWGYQLTEEDFFIISTNYCIKMTC